MNIFVSSARAAAVVPVLVSLLVTVSACRSDDPAPAPAPRAAGEAGPAQVDAPSGPIVPKPEPLEPRAFTLEDRYLDAARRGDAKMLELSLEKGANPHAKDAFERSALALAVMEARSLPMVQRLRERGLAIDEPDTGGRTPLSWAAHNGDVAIVSYLLDQGVAVDSRDAQQQTPLLHAAMTGSRDAVARLLAAGAEADVADQFGDTPLMHACGKGHEEIARLLVDEGADPTREDQEGRTARDRAASGAAFCRELPQKKPGG